MSVQTIATRFDRGCALAAAEPPDLASARLEFSAAAAEGDFRGALVLSGFLAGGIGGARDWPGAVEVLRRWAPRNTIAARQLALIEGMRITDEGDPIATPAPRRLHPTKRIELFPAFMTPAECAFIISTAVPRLERAKVLIGVNTVDLKPRIRDNDVASFTPAEAPPFVHAIMRRIAAATVTRVTQGEPLQIMRYAPGQQYRPHVDGVGGGANRRILTAIIYLNDDYRGGETAFTELDLKVRGMPGDMLLFRNLRDDGEIDREMRHAGTPVTDGVKFIASRWILQRPPYDDQGKLLGETLWS